MRALAAAGGWDNKVPIASPHSPPDPDVTSDPYHPSAAAPGAAAGPSRASYLASTLSASLELVKEGALEARQLEAFADVYLRAKASC